MPSFLLVANLCNPTNVVCPDLLIKTTTEAFVPSYIVLNIKSNQCFVMLYAWSGVRSVAKVTSRVSWRNMASHTEGKVFLVTGSTDGIGKHTAMRLAQAGGKVIIHGRQSSILNPPNRACSAGIRNVWIRSLKKLQSRQEIRRSPAMCTICRL